MISKQFILFSILCSSLFAKIEVNLELNKNDSIYKLESNDIVFKDDKLKFSMKSDKNEVLEMFRDLHDETGVIVFFVGMEEANAKFKKHGHYYSRIVNFVKFEPIGKEDIKKFLV